MAEWQTNELAGITEIAYVVAMTEDGNKKYPDANDLLAWQEEYGFKADALLLDPDVTPQGTPAPTKVMSQYVAANPPPPGEKYTEAITVIFDRDMRIHEVGTTYVHASDDYYLNVLLELVNK